MESPSKTDANATDMIRRGDPFGEEEDFTRDLAGGQLDGPNVGVTTNINS